MFSMGLDTEKSFVMAERLKQLREGKGLSHDRLSKALFDQYGIKISSDSLINYEVADAAHTKAYKNQGMRVEYLQCLADFYEVSTDYLLGITNVKSSDLEIRNIVQKTGLSEECVQHLIDMNNAGTTTIHLVLGILAIDEKYRISGVHRNYRTIVDLLWFFLQYDGSGNRKRIDPCGHITDSDPLDISLDTIELDDVIIENAALFEIQKVLVNMKAAMRMKRADDNAVFPNKNTR